jgi:hypothetical protein
VEAYRAQPEIEPSNSVRLLRYNFKVEGTYSETDQDAEVSVTGRQTRPDTYQFHVIKKRPEGDHHHVYNSHYLPSPNDWHITGPIVGRVDGVEGVMGLAVAQSFRRIAYHVPVKLIRRLVARR